MKRSGTLLWSLRMLGAGTLIAGSATLAPAQRGKPAGPPVTTRGSVQSNEKADKGQANAEAKRAEARARKAEHDADKAAESVERDAWKSAHGESEALLKGVKLSAADKAALAAIRNRYADERLALKRNEDAQEKAEHARRKVVGRIDSLRLRERAELRSHLNPDQQAQYDRNVAKRGAKKS